MRREWMSRFFKFILLLGFWIVICGELNRRTLITGLISVLVVLIVTEYSFRKYESQQVLIRHHFHLLWFLVIVLIEIFLAAYQHILRVMAGEDRSIIFELELNIEDEFAIALIANAITLTPGTMTLQVHNQTLTILGFAETNDDVDDICHVILHKFQKPFLGGDPL